MASKNKLSYNKKRKKEKRGKHDKPNQSDDNRLIKRKLIAKLLPYQSISIFYHFDYNVFPI